MGDAGLIPTHARNTCCPDSSPSPTRAHPRPRGENTYVVTPWCYAEGSSPLTQGKPQVTVEGTVEEGLIPAHAGKTLHNPAHRSASTAHPRSRGENIYGVIAAVADWGSSPLTRGKHHEPLVAAALLRLIPAHAGKTLHNPAHRSASTAHPRSRGENIYGVIAAVADWGSSPLTRGKHHEPLVAAALLRLIPAHAGKTRRYCDLSRYCRAHPRSRGENLGRAGQVRPDRGSSPLTRGKHAALVGAGHDRGLIPAHAGKTIKAGTVAAIEAAHPRSRGENVVLRQLSGVTAGSSPLTRGKLGCASFRYKTSGLIPAHAGKTGLVPLKIGA